MVLSFVFSIPTPAAAPPQPTQAITSTPPVAVSFTPTKQGRQNLPSRQAPPGTGGTGVTGRPGIWAQALASVAVGYANIVGDRKIDKKDGGSACRARALDACESMKVVLWVID